MGRVQLRNVIAVVPGRSPQTIVVMAHRDNAGDGIVVTSRQRLGTAALVQLARAYTRREAGSTRAHDRVPVDGRQEPRRARRAELRRTTQPRHERSSRSSISIRLPRMGSQASRSAGPDRTLRRLRCSAPPHRAMTDETRPVAGANELHSGSSSISPFRSACTSSGRSSARSSRRSRSRRPGTDPVLGPTGRTNATALGQVGRPPRRSSRRSTRASSCPRARAATSTSTGRIVHGWAIALVLVALVVPFAVASVDLFARCRRRHVAARLGASAPTGGASVFWLWVGALFGLFALFGAWPGGATAPPDPVAARPATGRGSRSPSSRSSSARAGSSAAGRLARHATRDRPRRSSRVRRPRCSCSGSISLCSSSRPTSTPSSSSCPRCMPGCGSRRYGTGPAVTRRARVLRRPGRPGASALVTREAVRARVSTHPGTLRS